MKTNRFVSLALAGAMATAMTVPALAVDPPNMSTKFTSTYTAPTISVVVPQSAAAVINPLGLGMSVKDSNDANFNLTGQIVSAPAAIENKSDLRLDIGATVIGSIKAVSDADFTLMKFAATTTKGSGTEGTEGYVAPATGKSAFVQLQVASGGAAFASKEDVDAIQDAVIAESAKDATWASAGAVTVSTKEVTGTKLATLEKPTIDTTDGSFTSHKAGSVALIRLTGDCVKAPKGGWSEKDGFEVNVTFTFEPAADAPSSGG